MDREDGSLGASRPLSLQNSSQRARLISEGLQQRPFSESLTDGQLAHLSSLLSVLCGFMNHISDFFLHSKAPVPGRKKNGDLLLIALFALGICFS